MDLLQLQYFRAIATHGSMSKAAQVLFVSQPTLSITMTRLEEDLGFSLFVRQKGKLTLTKEGKKFLACVDRILNDLDQTISNIRTESSNQDVSIRVTGGMNDLLGAVMARHYDGLREMRIFQVYSDNDHVTKLVADKEVDWGIVYGSSHALNLKLSFIHGSPRVFVMRKGHPLLRYDKMPASELGNHIYVCNRARDEKPLLTLLGRRFHFIPEINSECDDDILEMHILNSTDCIATMPMLAYLKLLRINPEQPLAYLEADFDLPPIQAFVVSREEDILSSYSNRLINYIRQFMEDEQKKLETFLKDGTVLP